MKKLVQRLHGAHGDERGITGLETAIILIAFVVVATVFAFVVLTTGIFSSERGKETVFAGLEKARGTMEVRGGVVVSATGSPLAVDVIQFAVAPTAGGESISLNPSASENRTVIAYPADTDTVIVGDTDTLLEPGELHVISVDTGDISPAPTLAANDRFTLEVQTPVGAVVDLTRQLPAELAAVMQL